MIPTSPVPFNGINHYFDKWDPQIRVVRIILLLHSHEASPVQAFALRSLVMKFMYRVRISDSCHDTTDKYLFSFNHII